MLKLRTRKGLIYRGSGSGGGVLNTSARNIASGVRAPGWSSGSQSNGTNTTSNCRSMHYNESGVATTTLRLIYGGWRLDTTSESAMGNAYTVTASIEYPAGTFTQVTWDSGSTSKSIGVGLNVLSDAISVAIPAGAKFWVRTFVSVSAGQFWPLCGTLKTSDESCDVGVGLADLTMGGTITGTNAGLRPAAIVGPWSVGMKKTSMMNFSDSIGVGSGDGSYDSNGNTAWIGRAATNNCPFISCGVVGQTLANQVVSGKMNFRIDLAQKAGVTHAVCSYGVNDSTDYATTAANYLTMWNALSPYCKVYQTTTGPRSTSSLGSAATHWSMISVQTATARYDGSSSIGAQLNDYIRTIPAPLSGYIDNSDLLSTSRYSGIWITGDSNPQTRLLPSSSLSATGTPTTTNVPFTPTLPSTAWNDYFRFGSTYYTSGVLNGVFAASVTSHTNTAVAYSVALSSAPSSGDTFFARPAAVSSTNDGLHPAVNTNAASVNSGNLYSGHMILMDSFIPVIQSWNA